MSIRERINLFWHDSDETNYKAVEGKSGRFDLYLNNLLVGTLTYNNGIWHYAYSDEFKNQQQYAPLVNFPSLTQEYESDQLWPFFASRLPGTNQLNNKKIEDFDILTLLKKYGSHVITNPYTLQSQLAI